MTEINSQPFIDFGHEKFKIVVRRISKSFWDEVNELKNPTLSFLSTLVSLTLILLAKINLVTIHLDTINVISSPKLHVKRVEMKLANVRPLSADAGEVHPLSFRPHKTFSEALTCHRKCDSAHNIFCSGIILHIYTRSTVWTFACHLRPLSCMRLPDTTLVNEFG
jgi:hypothetical protein